MLRTAPQTAVLGFVDVNQVRFESSGGTDAADDGGSGTHFVTDDMTFDRPVGVPEPISVLFLGSGLAGIGLVARRRREPMDLAV